MKRWCKAVLEDGTKISTIIEEDAVKGIITIDLSVEFGSAPTERNIIFFVKNESQVFRLADIILDKTTLPIKRFDTFKLSPSFFTGCRYEIHYGNKFIPIEDADENGSRNTVTASKSTRYMDKFKQNRFRLFYPGIMLGFGLILSQILMPKGYPLPAKILMVMSICVLLYIIVSFFFRARQLINTSPTNILDRDLPLHDSK